MTFQVVNTEGSVIMSCATSISLNLIQIHSELHSSVPECGKLIYSCADDPEKYKHKKPKLTEVVQWKNQFVQENKKQSVTSSRNKKPKVKLQEDDRNIKKIGGQRSPELICGQ